MLIFELGEIDDSDYREYRQALHQSRYQLDLTKKKQAEEELPKIHAKVTSAYRDVLLTLWENSSVGFMGMMYKANVAPLKTTDPSPGMIPQPGFQCVAILTADESTATT